MKFALACDSSKVDSYFCKDNKVYLYNGQPYYRMHHISNECLMGFWNYPMLFDGHFINLRDNEFPDEDFEDGVTYISCKHDFSDLQEKINIILGNYEKFSYIIDNMRRRLIDKMNPDNVALHLYNIFKNLDNITV